MKNKIKARLIVFLLNVGYYVFSFVYRVLVYGTIFFIAYLIAIGLVKLGVSVDLAFDLGEYLALALAFVVLFIRKRRKRNKLKNSESKETETYKLN